MKRCRPREIVDHCSLATGRLMVMGMLSWGWLTTIPDASAEGKTAAAVPGGDLSGLSLEQLVNVQVTSVSKREESLSRASAAITVVSQDDIQRSGARTIAEALRLAPGLSVARVDSHTWAISARGFNDSFANKLLVLMDGRSVYTPLFSGVYWDVQDTMLEDIDRIEVIRGPGATLWGANAVNGVINIITKSAKDTTGGLAVAGGGNEELGFGALRYGGKLGENAYYRVYSKYDSRDSSALPNGDLADDRWQMARTGFRIDWEANANANLTFQGDLYGGWLDQTYRFPTLTAPDYFEVASKPIDVSGGNFLTRWTQDLSADSDMTLQIYYDRTRRDSRGLLMEERDTVDVDWQHHWRLNDWNYWTWGLGYRASFDHLEGNFVTSFDDERRTSQLASLFAQDEIQLVPDRLNLVLGSKFEHNDYTGFEIQPGARLSWTPDDHQTFWVSVARAVRTPSRAEDGIRLNDRVSAGAPPTVGSVFGNLDYKSEELTAYEAGYRVQLWEKVSVDLATFYNVYEDLRTTEFRGAALDPSLPGSPIVGRLDIDNGASGETFGGELALTWHARDWWRWRGSYSLLEAQLHPKSSSNDSDAEDDERKSPHHQVALQTSLDLPGNIHWDVAGRYVDQLRELGVDAYFAMDMRLSWRPRPNLELSIVGQNLFDDRHLEFVPTIIPIQRTETQRSIYGKVSFSF
ncbi:MAG: TonB-dependent receptor [Verrucomicrobia bacterium]|nr:TonB-dependent receptor [Verrucomicrobiota bacterium]